MQLSKFSLKINSCRYNFSLLQWKAWEANSTQENISKYCLLHFPMEVMPETEVKSSVNIYFRFTYSSTFNTLLISKYEENVQMTMNHFV